MALLLVPSPPPCLFRCSRCVSLFCGDTGLFCGDIRLFCGDVDLFYAKISAASIAPVLPSSDGDFFIVYRSFAEILGSSAKILGLFCGDIGLFCGDVGLFYERISAVSISPALSSANSDTLIVCRSFADIQGSFVEIQGSFAEM